MSTQKAEKENNQDVATRPQPNWNALIGCCLQTSGNLSNYVRVGQNFSTVMWEIFNIIHPLLKVIGAISGCMSK